MANYPPVPVAPGPPLGIGPPPAALAHSGHVVFLLSSVWTAQPRLLSGSGLAHPAVTADKLDQELQELGGGERGERPAASPPGAAPARTPFPLSQALASTL
ncbi:beta-sarcoglycan [Platysternon megacephalum]|uniref:Beta-sarcoglycan n=1 Tax=Platysternon megacephalum TaxID=55544 RepID=A0A4D9EWX0_9SAUR|nr:beta-sarcoglycan [Platysternon megacephalum]